MNIKTLSQVATQEMTRKEFIIYSGLILVSLTGIPSVLQFAGKIANNQHPFEATPTAGSGYGGTHRTSK